MKRNRFLLRMCGVGMLTLLTPLMAMAQGTGTTGATGSTGSTGSTGATTSAAAPGVTHAVGAGLTQKTATLSATGGTTGSATSIPSNANKFISTYVIPNSLGMPSLYASQFGAENVISTNGGPKGKYTYLYVAPPSAATTTATTQTQANGFTTYGQLRNPVYQMSFSDQIPIVQHNITDLHARVRDAIQNSSRLAGKNNILVNVEGDTLVLTGAVTSEHERRLAEGLARITPGVNGVALRNDITVVTLNK